MFWPLAGAEAKKSKKGNKKSHKVAHGASSEAAPVDTKASFNDDCNIKGGGREAYGKGIGKKGTNTGKGKHDPLANRQSRADAATNANCPRADRRALRTKLQAERERLRG